MHFICIGNDFRDIKTKFVVASIFFFRYKVQKSNFEVIQKYSDKITLFLSFNFTDYKM